MDGLFVTIILIMSVVIHEISHGYMALALGDVTAQYQGRLTLNPIKHLDPIGSVLLPILGFLTGGFIIGWAKPVPFNPYNLNPQKWGIPARFGEPLVAIVGPLSNIIIAVIFGLFIRFFYSPEMSLFLTNFISISSSIVVVNITLAIFNLVPIPPLDGSKVLFSLLPIKYQYILRNLEQNGMIFVFIFVLLFWGYISPIVFSIFSLITGINI